MRTPRSRKRPTIGKRFDDIALQGIRGHHAAFAGQGIYQAPASTQIVLVPLMMGHALCYIRIIRRTDVPTFCTTMSIRDIEVPVPAPFDACRSEPTLGREIGSPGGIKRTLTQLG